MFSWSHIKGQGSPADKDYCRVRFRKQEQLSAVYAWSNRLNPSGVEQKGFLRYVLLWVVRDVNIHWLTVCVRYAFRKWQELSPRNAKWPTGNGSHWAVCDWAIETKYWVWSRWEGFTKQDMSRDPKETSSSTRNDAHPLLCFYILCPVSCRVVTWTATLRGQWTLEESVDLTK